MNFGEESVIYALANAYESLNSLFVAEKMSGNSYPSMASKNITTIMEKIQSEIKINVTSHVRLFVEQLNNDLQKGRHLKAGLWYITNDNQTITICNRVKYTFKKFTLEELEKFKVVMSKSESEAIKFADLISKNRTKYYEILKQVPPLVEEKFGVKLTNLKLEMPLKYDCVEDVIYTTSTNNKIQFRLVLTTEITPEREAKVLNDILSQIKYEIFQSKRDLIRSFVKNVCEANKLPKFEIEYFTENSKTPYNFNLGQFDISIDINNKAVQEKLSRDIVNAIVMIMFLRETNIFSGKTSINLSQDMFFRFKDEKVVDGKQYYIYESKTKAHEKVLLYVFCDGQQLRGNARKKAIKLLGFGKKYEHDPKDWQYNSTKIIQQELSKK